MGDLVLKPEQTSQIQDAAAILMRGGVVAFPTETVYGLGADTTNPDAVRRIFAIKGRPANHPVIVHIGRVCDLDVWAREIPDAARRLAERFWPGPLTLVLLRQPHVPDVVTGGQDTVGLRMPDHPVALALLRELGSGKGLAAPSANRFGRISPTTAEHVRVELGESVDMILDGGACRVGLESTIISFADGTPVLLRPGGIPVAELEDALGGRISTPEAARSTVRAPGMLASHYAPTTPLEVWSSEALPRRAQELAALGQRIVVLEQTSLPLQYGDNLLRCAMPIQAPAYAHSLYATLRQMDAAGFDRILVEAPPDTNAWQAVNDRLRRAATLYCTNNETQPMENMHEKVA